MSICYPRNVAQSTVISPFCPNTVALLAISPLPSQSPSSFASPLRPLHKLSCVKRDKIRNQMTLFTQAIKHPATYPASQPTSNYSCVKRDKSVHQSVSNYTGPKSIGTHPHNRTYNRPYLQSPRRTPVPAPTPCPLPALIPKQVVTREISSGHDLMATCCYYRADESAVELRARPCARAPESARLRLRRKWQQPAQCMPLTSRSKPPSTASAA